MIQEVLIEVFLGLALFMYGITLMNQSLKALSLDKIKALMGKATSNRILAFFAGIGVTSIIQSSSATSVIVIGLLNVGVLGLVQAVPIIFGANIGTTITAQLIAFKLTGIAPIFVISGLLMHFLSKSLKRKNIALAIFGFGLLFYGLSVMSKAVIPLRESQYFMDLFVKFGKYPWLGLLIGMMVTMILQSSSTVIGIMIAMAASGILDFQSAFYLLLGENIGTCITAVLASIGGTKSAKRFALAHALEKIIGAIIAIFMAPLYFKFMPMLSGDIARQIANAHTTFNVFNSLIFLPLVPLYVKLLKKILPGEDYVKKETQYLDKNLLDTPTLAINSAVKEMVVMNTICKNMLTKLSDSDRKFDYKKYREIETDELSVDEMQKNITNYLAQVTQKELSDKEVNLLPSLLHSVNDLERVGDHIENLAKIFRRKHEGHVDFSDEAHKEIKELFDNIQKMFELTIIAMRDDNHVAACESIKIEERTNIATKMARDRHVEWLRKGTATADKALIFNDILIHLERIGDHLFNITQGIIHYGKR